MRRGWFASRFLDRRIANTRDRKPVWIRPRRGVREGAPAARPVLYRARGVAHNPRWLLGRRDDAHRDIGVLVGVVAGADAVVAVGDLQGHPGVEFAAHDQDGRESRGLLDLLRVSLRVR